MKTIFVAVTIVFFGFLAFINPAYAADVCPVVYGGGQMECGTPTPQPKGGTVATATPTKAPAPTKTPTNNQSKGGLPVQEVSKTDTTPATGPEALGLISLIPLAAAGFYLRKKTQRNG